MPDSRPPQQLYYGGRMIRHSVQMYRLRLSNVVRAMVDRSSE
jgi:hypothetical protein